MPPSTTDTQTSTSSATETTTTSTLTKTDIRAKEIRGSADITFGAEFDSIVGDLGLHAAIASTLSSLGGVSHHTTDVGFELVSRQQRSGRSLGTLTGLLYSITVLNSASDVDSAATVMESISNMSASALESQLEQDIEVQGVNISVAVESVEPPEIFDVTATATMTTETDTRTVSSTTSKTTIASTSTQTSTTSLTETLTTTTTSRYCERRHVGAAAMVDGRRAIQFEIPFCQNRAYIAEFEYDMQGGVVEVDVDLNGQTGFIQALKIAGSDYSLPSMRTLVLTPNGDDTIITLRPASDVDILGDVFLKLSLDEPEAPRLELVLDMQASSDSIAAFMRSPDPRRDLMEAFSAAVTGAAQAAGVPMHGVSFDAGLTESDRVEAGHGSALRACSTADACHRLMLGRAMNFTEFDPDCNLTTNTSDNEGLGCSEYEGFPSLCGHYDDTDFTANDMCCACPREAQHTCTHHITCPFPSICAQGVCTQCSASDKWCYEQTCGPGYYESTEGGDCLPCVGGETRRRRASECTDCDVGYYDVGDRDDCLQCTDGFTRRRRATLCTECGVGTYIDVQEETCRQCIGGASRRRRSNSCDECPEGYYNSGAWWSITTFATAEDCHQCVGGETRRRRSISCDECAAGRYDSGDNDDCELCPDGATRRRRSMECTDCPEGFAKVDQNTDDCLMLCDAVGEFGMSTVYPCICGEEVCKNNEFCDPASDTCEPAPCRAFPAGNTAYPCSCGDELCVANYPFTCGGYGLCLANETCTDELQSVCTPMCTVTDGSAESTIFPCICGTATCNGSAEEVTCFASENLCTTSPTSTSTTLGSTSSETSTQGSTSTTLSFTLTGTLSTNATTITTITMTTTSRVCPGIHGVSEDVSFSAQVTNELGYVVFEQPNDAWFQWDLPLCTDYSYRATLWYSLESASAARIRLTSNNSQGQVVKFPTTLDWSFWSIIDVEVVQFSGQDRNWIRLMAMGSDSPRIGQLVLSEGSGVPLSRAARSVRALDTPTATVVRANLSLGNMSSADKSLDAEFYYSLVQITKDFLLKGILQSYVQVETGGFCPPGPDSCTVARFDGLDLSVSAFSDLGHGSRSELGANKIVTTFTVDSSQAAALLSGLPDQLATLQQSDSVFELDEWGTSVDCIKFSIGADELDSNQTRCPEVDIGAGGVASPESDFWALLSGPCRVVDRCIESDNFPDVYASDEECVIEARFPPNWFLEQPEYFMTEAGFDRLVINGVAYSGSVRPPSGETPNGTITWTSDSNTAIGGFRLCAGTCDVGTYKDVDENGQAFCLPCLPGEYSNVLAATACEKCPPGSFSAFERSTSCQACPEGTFSDTAGKSDAACSPCEPGKFAPSSNSSRCDDCRSPNLPDFLMWTTMEQLQRPDGGTKWVELWGAVNETSCGCKPGFWKTDAGSCDECRVGMTCPGMDDLLIQAGFFSTQENRGSIYECFDDYYFNRCPGGLPGTCGLYRDNTSFICLECEKGKVAAIDGTCKDCTPASTFYIILAVLGAVSALTGIYRMFLMETRSRHGRSVAGMIVVASLLLTGGQVLSILESLSITWPAPWGEWIQYSKILTFRLATINAGCVMPMTPLMEYTSKLATILAMIAVLLAVHWAHTARVAVDRRRSYNNVLFATVGSIFMAFFIAISSMVLIPWQCEVHPNGVQTLRGLKSVVCFDSGQAEGLAGGAHTQLMYAGVASAVIPMGFLALGLWVQVRLPSALYLGNVEFLDRYKFFFYRFHPKAYEFFFVMILRNFAMALVPILTEPVVQIIVIAALLLPSNTLTAMLLPWREYMGNHLEVIMNCGLAFVCLLAALTVHEYQVDPETLGVLCCLLFGGALTVIVGAMLFALALRFLLYRVLGYSFHLVYWKHESGSFARLLKMTLARHPRVVKDVSMSADLAKGVSQPFTGISESSKVVLLHTPGILEHWEPMGEIVHARACNKDVVVMAFPRMDNIGKKQLVALRKGHPEIAKLNRYGIDIHMVTQAVESLNGCRKLQVSQRITLPAVSDLTESLVDPAHSSKPAGTSSNLTRSSRHPLTGDLVIIVDGTSIEALSAAYILKVELASSTQFRPHVMESTNDFPDHASRALLLCTAACWSNPDVLNALVGAAQRGLLVLAVVVDDRFGDRLVRRFVPRMMQNESNQLESNQLESNRLESNQPYSNRLESNQLESNQLEPASTLPVSMIEDIIGESRVRFCPYDHKAVLTEQFSTIRWFLESPVRPPKDTSAVCASKAIRLVGGLLEEHGVDCIASFPGRCADEMQSIVGSRVDLSIACVFTPDRVHGLGKHAPMDPSKPDGECWCRALYGRGNFRQLGYLVDLPCGLSIAERAAKVAELNALGVQVIDPEDSPAEISRKEQEAERQCSNHMRRAVWGCAWFMEWKRKVDAAVRLSQKLKVYFYEGQAGQGVVSWQDLAATDLWDGIGLGASQKIEVAHLDRMGYAYESVDVGSTARTAARSFAALEGRGSRSSLSGMAVQLSPRATVQDMFRETRRRPDLSSLKEIVVEADTNAPEEQETPNTRRQSRFNSWSSAEIILFRDVVTEKLGVIKRSSGLVFLSELEQVAERMPVDILRGEPGLLAALPTDREEVPLEVAVRFLARLHTLADAALDPRTVDYDQDTAPDLMGGPSDVPGNAAAASALPWGDDVVPVLNAAPSLPTLPQSQATSSSTARFDKKALAPSPRSGEQRAAGAETASVGSVSPAQSPPRDGLDHPRRTV